LALQHRKRKSSAATLIYNRASGRLARQTVLRQHFFYVLKIGINRESTSLGHASWQIRWLSGDIEPQSYDQRSFFLKTTTTTSPLCPKNELQWSVNDFSLGIIQDARDVRQPSCIIALSAAILGETCHDNIAPMS